MGIDIFGGDIANAAISNLKKSLFSHGDGKIVISNRNREIKSAVIITDDGVNITNGNSTGGVFISNGCVTSQGTSYATAKGTSVRKGEFSENNNTTKIFTYYETVLMESIPKEVASQVAGQAGVNISMSVPGTNTSIGMDGIMNIVTDLASGPLPHVHSISMKHVHRIEPPTLYRIPSAIGFVKSCLTQLTSFLLA